MAEDSEKQAFNREFIARTKWAREASPHSQDDMAEFFDMDQGTWKQYETRSPLPHMLVSKFCRIVQCDIYWLFTGKGTAPEKPEELVDAPKRRRGASKARKSA